MNFKLKILALLSCLFLMAPTVANAQDDTEKTLDILFIGNSFTFFNSLDQTVGNMLTVSGIPTNATCSAPGGWRFRLHYNGEIPEKNYNGAPTPEMIKLRKWDYVVLQEFSSGSVEQYKDFMEYGQKLVDLIHENSPETKIILYQTWERCDGMFEGYGDDEARKDEVIAAWTKRYKEPSEETVAQLKTGIQGAYDDLQKATDSTLAPVGKAFLTVGDKIDLYGAEGKARPFHPNPCGTYLAGCVFFKTITGKSPVGLWQKLSDAGKDHKVTEEDATYLEKIADKVVE